MVDTGKFPMYNANCKMEYNVCVLECVITEESFEIVNASDTN